MNWKTVLTSGGVTLVVYSSHAATDTSATKDESWVQRKKMAKDMGSTNHLLFMEIWSYTELTKTNLTLIQAVRGIFLDDNKMPFELEKCAVLETRRGRKVINNGIDLPDSKNIGKFGTRATDILAFYNWTVEELFSMDRKNRKILAMNCCLHTRSNVTRLYLPRKKGKEGWLVLRTVLKRSANPCMATGGIARSGYCRWFWRKRCLWGREYSGIEEEQERGETKQLEGKSSTWIICSTNFRCGRKGVLELAQKGFFLKKETQDLIFAAQEQGLRTNSGKHSVDKVSETQLYRLCGECTETVWDIVSACRKLAPKEYRRRHDKVALQVHWELCRIYELECNDKWYDYQPLPII